MTMDLTFSLPGAVAHTQEHSVAWRAHTLSLSELCTAQVATAALGFPLAVCETYEGPNSTLHYDVDHHLHHADPGDPIEVIEDFGDAYLGDTISHSLQISGPIAAAITSARLLWSWYRRRASPLPEQQAAPPSSFWRWLLWTCVGWSGSLLRCYAALVASWLCGCLFALWIYEVVHLSSHLPRQAQPEWLWLWSSAHRLHHRNPSANFGFHDSTWDWYYGTLGGPE